MESSLTSHLLSPPSSSATSSTSSSSSKYTNSKPTLTQRFLRPISLYPKTILLLYFILACACLAWPTRNFTPNTDSSFVAPTDSMSGDAEDRYSELYGGEGGIDMVVLLKSKNTSSPITASHPAATFVSALTNYSNTLSSSCARPSTILDYYTLSKDYSTIASSLVNSDSTATIVSINYVCDLKSDYVLNMRDFVNGEISWGENYEDLEKQFGEEVDAGITGVELFQYDILDGVEEDLSRMDTTILPLALLTLAFVLGSVPIMIIPITNILLTIIFAFAIMCPFALSTQVVSFTPSVMMSLVIAMSVDYSLFLLSRVQDEVAAGRTTEAAVENMVEHAGHTIVASGSTLCVCFAGMLFFPMEMLRSVGVGATVSILTALLVNLTLTPAFLYTAAGEYCLRPKGWAAKVCCAEDGSSRGVGSMLKKEERRMEEMGEMGIKDESGSLIGREARYKQLDEKLMYESLWYRLCRRLLDRRIGVPVLMVFIGLMMPVILNFTKLKTSIGFDLLLPESSPSLQTFDDMGTLFGAGTLSPYKVMFDATGLTNETIIEEAEDLRLGKVGTNETFTVMHEVINKLQGLPATNGPQYFNGIAQAGGLSVSYKEYVEAHAFSSRCGPDGSLGADSVACQFIISQEGLTPEMIEAANSLYLLSSTANDNLESASATYATTILNVDPFSNDGTDWLVSARDIVADLEASGSLMGIKVYFVDGAGIEYDAVTQVYDVFPVLITATLATVFVLMGVFFRSVVVPIRSVVSIALTLMFVFGLTVLIYQDGIFDPLGLACMSKTGEISWLPPVMTFSIVVGLGLDYDVFLISRVLEFREEGYSDDSAVLAGVWKTGSVITCAGIIMALAFAGLLMSEELLLNQTAFILVVSVLIDTFVVRTVLVPILLGVTRSQSWWPRSLPEIRVDLEQRRKEKEVRRGEGEESAVLVSA